jgi:hypothetical protein
LHPILLDREVWSTGICYWKGLNINTMIYNNKGREKTEDKCKIIGSCSWWKEMNGVSDLYITLVQNCATSYMGVGLRCWYTRRPDAFFTISNKKLVPMFIYCR